MFASKTIAIIPARGGSKRLTGKNLLPLGNKSLLAHSIAYAKDNEKWIDTIVVTTDDTFIKEEAIQNGVSVIERPDSISGDTATTVSALQHVLETLDSDFENVVLLQVTNPIRPANLLKKAMTLYKTTQCDSVMTVSEKKMKLGKMVANRYVPFNYSFGQRSQDIEPLYEENGLLYITKASKIKKGIILAENNRMLVIPSEFPIIDIDTETDYLKAKAYFRNIKK